MILLIISDFEYQYKRIIQEIDIEQQETRHGCHKSDVRLFRVMLLNFVTFSKKTRDTYVCGCRVNFVKVDSKRERSRFSPPLPF